MRFNQIPTFFLTCLVAHTATCAAGSSIPVDVISSKNRAENSVPPSSFNVAAAPDRLIESLLISQTKSKVAHNLSASSLVRSSSIELPSGNVIYKYAHHYQGKPVLGDWAMSTVARDGRLDDLQFQISQPTQQTKRSQPQERWQMSEPQVRAKIQSFGLRPLNRSIRQIWYRRSNQLVPAISVNAGIMEGEQPVVYQLVFNAETQELLSKAQTSEYLTHYKYRIFADGTPSQPFQNPYGYTSPSTLPAPGDPRPTAFVAPQDFTIAELSKTADDPWLPDNSTEMVGNNVDVFFNFTRSQEGVYDFFGDGYGPQYRARGDAFDLDFRAPVSNGNELLFDYDPADYLEVYNQREDSMRNPTEEEIELINAQQVNAFYLANFLHNLFYDAGFTETAGNAQFSNFRRGGIEGDPLIIHINGPTFIATPKDGESPVIHLGQSFGGSTAFDVSVFAHEWAHYLFRRLVNPTMDITNNQSRALNEGWADVVGVLMGMKEQDFVNGQSGGFQSSYAVGAYFRQDLFQPDFLNPFFYGIRRYPFGPDNPFTFEHIAHKAPLPTGFDYSIYLGRGTQNSQIHTAGEVWANTVLACFRDVIANRGPQTFNGVRRTLASIIVAAMARTPQDPTFLEARDALLAALRSDFSQHYGQCKAHFIAKGMGSGAVAPPRESKDFTERVASFVSDDFNLSIVDAQLLEVGGGLDNDGVLDTTENGVLKLRLRNTGFEAITEATVNLNPNSTRFQILGSGLATIQDLPIGADVTVSLPLRLTHSLHFDLTPFAVRITIDGREFERQITFRTHYDLRQSTDSQFVGDNLGIAFQDWRLERIQQQSFVDSKWQVLNSDANQTWQIDEPLLRAERFFSVERGLVSPWLTASSGLVSVEFAHAFQLTGEGVIEISTDEQTWLPFDQSEPVFDGSSRGFPALLPRRLINTNLVAGERFKVRLRVASRTPLTWRLDDFRITGVQSSPFKTVVAEDDIDENTVCFPIKAQQTMAVVCL